MSKHDEAICISTCSLAHRLRSTEPPSCSSPLSLEPCRGLRMKSREKVPYAIVSRRLHSPQTQIPWASRDSSFPSLYSLEAYFPCLCAFYRYKRKFHRAHGSSRLTSRIVNLASSGQACNLSDQGRIVRGEADSDIRHPSGSGQQHDVLADPPKMRLVDVVDATRILASEMMMNHR